MGPHNKGFSKAKGVPSCSRIGVSSTPGMSLANRRPHQKNQGLAFGGLPHPSWRPALALCLLPVPPERPVDGAWDAYYWMACAALQRADLGLYSGALRWEEARERRRRRAGRSLFFFLFPALSASVARHFALLLRDLPTNTSSLTYGYVGSELSTLDRSLTPLSSSARPRKVNESRAAVPPPLTSRRPFVSDKAWPGSSARDRPST